MGKKILFLLSSLFFIFECTWMQKIEREIKPKEKYDIQIDEKGCAIYKDGIITISLEIMDDSHWEDLLVYDLFINKKSKSSIWRTPKLLFMHMVIINNGENPVSVEEIKLNYKNTQNAVLSYKDLKEKLKSPLYSLASIKALTSKRRLLNDKYHLKEIDYDKDAVNYNLNFISPGDKISRILAFNWIPVEIRQFAIEFNINNQIQSKKIEFIYKRFEYRDKGHFAKPDIEEYGD